MTKRIAIVLDSLAGGGAERSMLTLAIAMQKLGYEPHLLILQKVGMYEVPNELPCHFWFLNKKQSCDPIFGMNKLSKKFLQWLMEIKNKVGDFDVYYSNLDKSNLLMSHAKVEPCFYVVHNAVDEELDKQRRLGPIKYYKMLRAKKALRNKNLITVSAGIANKLEHHHIVQAKSLHTIYNPFDIDDIRALANEIDVKIPAQDYIIHVGRFAKQKRHDVLFQALKYMQITIPVVLLCNNVQKAAKMAEKYGVRDKVILPGFQGNPYPWIKNAKLMVLCSDHEGLGNVIIESLICGTPVVSTDCPYGPNEILTGPLANYLVPCGDPIKLAQSMERALKQYPTPAEAEILAKVQAIQVARSYIELNT